MKEIVSDTSLIAACGLYCGACQKYLKGNCSGCAKNEKASWCKTRSCCQANNYKSCADCRTNSYTDCKKVNNVVSKLFGLVFNSNRIACLDAIKRNGYETFANQMTAQKRMTFPRKQK